MLVLHQNRQWLFCRLFNNSSLLLRRESANNNNGNNTCTSLLFGPLDNNARSGRQMCQQCRVFALFVVLAFTLQTRLNRDLNNTSVNKQTTDKKQQPGHHFGCALSLKTTSCNQNQNVVPFQHKNPTKPTAWL
jgi:hypothetical protein